MSGSRGTRKNILTEPLNDKIILKQILLKFRAGRQPAFDIYSDEEK